MAEKPIPFYILPKPEVSINQELKETFDSVNKALSDACELLLKQPIPGTQLVLMMDASSRNAGYALMIEDNPDQKIQSNRKAYASVGFGSKIFSPAKIKMSIYPKEFLAFYMAFPEFAHLPWEAAKPTVVLTDESVALFSQQKQFREHSGVHATMCCNLISKQHTSLAQSTPQLFFSLE